ncbi:hypothetical protein GALL_478690 [mine drainage metagenome]|uniref:Uncharacterized protein n=1 Tax=mine drainage metagenome TaxID=410659 RepID=A0A1J5PZ13_9ZZZZ
MVQRVSTAAFEGIEALALEEAWPTRHAIGQHLACRRTNQFNHMLTAHFRVYKYTP